MTAWPLVLGALTRHESLSPEAAAWAMGELMTGAASPAQAAGFLLALRTKGETAVEVDALARAMLAHAERLAPAPDAVDTCGTGGDGAHTVNVSTMAALVVRAAGTPVVKHGNRAASSRCGTADVLEELGIPLDLEPHEVQRVFDEAGITFCFAPVFHPAMRHVAPVRRELGVPTVFNVLGPLVNPAQPGAQLVGCAVEGLAPVMAQVLAARGARALVVRGPGGLDELTGAGRSEVWLVADGRVSQQTLDPHAAGLPAVSVDDLRGGDAARNAGVLRQVLAGQAGPVLDTVVLNAAAALLAAAGPRHDEPLATQLAEPLARARAAVPAAGGVLEAWLAAARGARSARG